MTARAQQLVEVAVTTSPDQLQRALAVEVRNIQRGDEIARLERQRRATRLRSWVDGEGMWCLTGRFDPETGLALHGRLDATITTLLTDNLPDGFPDDPLERHGFLRAHALVALTHGRAGVWGRPEVVVVVDTTTPDAPAPPPSTGDSPSNSPPPSSTASFHSRRRPPRRRAPPESSSTARGQLDLGRSTRLANRARPAAPSAPCTPPAPSPGCTARYDLCRLHHVHASPASADGLVVVIMPRGRVAVFVVDGAEHVAVGVAAARVVPGFDPVEDRRRELLAVGPVVLVEELELQGPEEALGDAVVEAVADGAHRAEQPGGSQPPAERPARCIGSRGRNGPRCRPAGRRRQIAICRASTTSSERM